MYSALILIVRTCAISSRRNPTAFIVKRVEVDPDTIENACITPRIGVGDNRIPEIPVLETSPWNVESIIASACCIS